jgi:putative transposase
LALAIESPATTLGFLLRPVSSKTLLFEEKLVGLSVPRRDGAAAKRFFRRLLRSHGGEPRKIVTDKLRSYGVAHRELMPDVIHDNSQYENNRAEQSHEPTRVRERGMRKFESIEQAQRFLGAHAAVSNLFNLGRHQVSAEQHRDLRVSTLGEWAEAVT